jgi:aquaporin Z
VWLRGRCPQSDVFPYIGSQLGGGIVASILVLALKGDGMVSPADIKVFPALIAELVGTFALAYVVLNTATAKATSGNSYYGLAIGFTLMVMVFAFGNVSGGAFNPAVAVGITVMHLAKAVNLWIYLVANFAAGALAAMAFKFINPEDK